MLGATASDERLAERAGALADLSELLAVSESLVRTAPLPLWQSCDLARQLQELFRCRAWGLLGFKFLQRRGGLLLLRLGGLAGFESRPSSSC